VSRGAGPALVAEAVASAGNFPGGGDALFDDTGAISSLLVVNGAGDPIGGSIAAASGTVYPTASSAPEPSCFLFIGGVLAGLVGLNRVRSSLSETHFGAASA
jgi:hypothetical protein